MRCRRLLGAPLIPGTFTVMRLWSARDGKGTLAAYALYVAV